MLKKEAVLWVEVSQGITQGDKAPGQQVFAQDFTSTMHFFGDGEDQPGMAKDDAGAGVLVALARARRVRPPLYDARPRVRLGFSLVDTVKDSFVFEWVKGREGGSRG